MRFGLCAVISAYLNETFKGRKKNSVEKKLHFCVENKQTNYAGLGERVNWAFSKMYAISHT